MIQVDPKTHERVRKEAVKRSLPVHDVATLLLNHALDSVKSGDVKISGPSITPPTA